MLIWAPMTTVGMSANLWQNSKARRIYLRAFESQVTDFFKTCIPNSHQAGKYQYRSLHLR